MIKNSRMKKMIAGLLGGCLAAGMMFIAPAPQTASAAAPADAGAFYYTVKGQWGTDDNGFVLTTSYPVVMMENRKAAEKISEEIAEEVQEEAQRYYERKTKGTVEAVDVGYDIKLNDSRYFSVMSYMYSYFKGAAHPMYVKKGMTFDMNTGKELKWKDLVRPADKKKLTLDAINKKLLFEKRDVIFDEFKGLKTLPENYYLDAKGKIHFIFQPYEIAPYAAGLIDLDTGCLAK